MGSSVQRDGKDGSDSGRISFLQAHKWEKWEEVISKGYQILSNLLFVNLEATQVERSYMEENIDEYLEIRNKKFLACLVRWYSFFFFFNEIVVNSLRNSVRRIGRWKQFYTKGYSI